MYTFLPNSDAGGITEASNAAVTATSTDLTPIRGDHLIISVGAYPIFIRFGKPNTAAVTSSNGLRLPANSVTHLSRPEAADTIVHIRDGSNDSTISVQEGISGT